MSYCKVNTHPCNHLPGPETKASSPKPPLCTFLITPSPFLTQGDDRPDDFFLTFFIMCSPKHACIPKLYSLASILSFV